MTGVNLGGGVSAGVGAPSEVDQELRDSFAGGENFIARVALLSARKRAAEEAEASLALGGTPLPRSRMPSRSRPRLIPP